MFIGISGLIGVGKSTLTKSLAEHLNYKAYYEPVQTNPYLEDFYKDMSRWTFPMQMFLLAKRYQQHQEVIWDPCHQIGSGVVQDRTIYEDTIFARMHYRDCLMDERDYNTYISHFNVMKRFLQYPDVIVYLKVYPELALERINKRSRDCEAGIPLSYLEDLYEGYETFISEIGNFVPVLTLDWNNYLSVEEVADRIDDTVRNNSKFMRSIVRI